MNYFKGTHSQSRGHRARETPRLMGGYGTDVATANGADALDHMALAFVMRLVQRGIEPVVLELGGAQGSLAIRMAEKGAHVVMIDKVSGAESPFEKAACSLTKGKLEFRQQDFSGLSSADIPQNLRIVVAQRSLHYRPYGDARDLLCLAYDQMEPGGKVFLSLAGCYAKFSRAYPHRHLPIEERFARLDSDMAKTTGIKEELAIYSEDDACQLLREAGYAKISVQRSEYGNVRAWATKASPR